MVGERGVIRGLKTIELESGRVGRLLEEVRVAGARVNRAVYAAGTETPSHAHPHADLCVTLAGRYEETWGRESGRLDAGCVLVKPPGLEHVDRFGPEDVTCINVDLAPGAWEELGGNALDGPRILIDPKLQRLGRELELELTTPDRASALAAEGLVLSLLAEALRADERASDRGLGSWLDGVRDRLHEEYATRLCLDVLAESAGVHAAHLTRRFRARFGCSVGDYVRRLRVAAALRGLGDLERPLAEVATGAGFSDQSHMGRVLRRELGMTPGAWRARLRTRKGSDRSSGSAPF